MKEMTCFHEYYNEDFIIFDEENLEEDKNRELSWKVIIADDEEEIHKVTKIVFESFCFEEKKIKFLSAYSSEETKKMIKENQDAAVILLDVVMEENDSGLKIVEYIRNELKNQFIRIILRTGQPGQAPEKKVIIDYDLNDYKEKTELTSQKLFTTMISALRNYRDITLIETNRKGLKKIIESSAAIFELQSIRKFVAEVLTQLIKMMNLNEIRPIKNIGGFVANREKDDYYILAGTEYYEKYIDKPVSEVPKKEIYKYLKNSSELKKNIYTDNKYIAYFKSNNKSENIIYIEGLKTLNAAELNLIDIFCYHIAIAFDNLYLKSEIEKTQKEVIFTLGEIAEARSKEMGNHVKRISKYCEILGKKYGLSESDINILSYASPMHDIGKIGIPDSILNKPGRLTNDEFEIIKTHTTIGYELLSKTERELLKVASLIALQHHEKYDGTGYPNGLLGEEIHIFARITALADVFDALGQDRIYKKAWPLDKIIEYISSERGKQFDPILVDIFFEHIDEILNIKDNLSDDIKWGN